MNSFIALVWNQRSTSAQQGANEILRTVLKHNSAWNTLTSAPGIVVLTLCTGPAVDRTYRLGENGGVIFGRLFRRSDYSPQTSDSLDESESARISSSGGDYLNDHYWGRYVAVLTDARTDSKWVLRDPTGAIPCYKATSQSVDIYFRRLEDVEFLDSLNLSINEDYVVRRLSNTQALTYATGLREVEMVLAGERIKYDTAGSRRQLFWDPMSVASHYLELSPDQAIKLLRDTVRACVSAWASCFDNIIQLLSGGLDSAIVLSCLADAPVPPNVICVNNYTLEDPRGDERHMAKLAASQAGFNLVERHVRSDYTMQLLSCLPRTPSPIPVCTDLEVLERERQFARAHRASAIFNGNGGDELFYRGGPLPTSVDFVHCRGLRPALAGTVLSDAQFDGVSVWHVLRAMLRYVMNNYRWNVEGVHRNRMRPFLSSAAHERVNTVEEDWAGLSVRKLAPGKGWQALNVRLLGMRTHNPVHPSDSPDSISPLISQPIVELCLRLPVFLLMSNGWDRALARMAFQQGIPAQIVARRLKGGSEQHVRAVLRHNFKKIRSLLLEGYLRQHGLIDTVHVQQALDNDPASVKACNLDILSLLDIEVWARAWVGSISR